MNTQNPLPPPPTTTTSAPMGGVPTNAIPNDPSATAAIDRWRTYLDDLREKESKAHQYISTSKSAIERGEVNQKSILEKWENYLSEIQDSIRSAEETIRKISQPHPQMTSYVVPPAISTAPTATSIPHSSAAAAVSSAVVANVPVGGVGPSASSVVIPPMGQMIPQNVQIPANPNELPFKRQRIDEIASVVPVVVSQNPAMGVGVGVGVGVGSAPPPQSAPQQIVPRGQIPQPVVIGNGNGGPGLMQQQQQQAPQINQPGAGGGAGGAGGQGNSLVFEVRGLLSHLDTVGPRIQNERDIPIPQQDLLNVFLFIYIHIYCHIRHICYYYLNS